MSDNIICKSKFEIDESQTMRSSSRPKKIPAEDNEYSYDDQPLNQSDNHRDDELEDI
jgi:hypothetical protein